MPAPKAERTTAAVDRAIAAKWLHVRFRDNREPSTRGDVLAAENTCWCGEPYGHDWEGKADGAPHPRDGAA
jgi:hypothetical protein